MRAPFVRPISAVIALLLVPLAASAGAPASPYQPTWDEARQIDAEDAWLFEGVEVVEASDGAGVLARFVALPAPDAVKGPSRPKKGEFETDADHKKRYAQWNAEMEVLKKPVYEARERTAVRVRVPGYFESRYDSEKGCFKTPFRVGPTNEDLYPLSSAKLEGSPEAGAIGDVWVLRSGKLAATSIGQCLTGEAASRFKDAAKTQKVEFVLYLFPSRHRGMAEHLGQVGHVEALGYVLLDGVPFAPTDYRRPVAHVSFRSRYSAAAGREVELVPRP